MKVDKVVTYSEPAEISIIDATLLSIEEAETVLTQEERAYDNWWWLRSPGSNQFSAAGVCHDGSVDYYGRDVLDDDECVRPALKILNLKSSNLKVGDKFIFGGKMFKIISESLAFCLEDIGNHCFREERKAYDANDYTKSDIKKFVDEWFKKAKMDEVSK